MPVQNENTILEKAERTSNVYKPSPKHDRTRSKMVEEVHEQFAKYSGDRPEEIRKSTNFEGGEKISEFNYNSPKKRLKRFSSAKKASYV